MLKPKLVSLFLGLLFTFPVFISADIAFRVTRVKAWLSENNFKGKCPHRFEFHASITVNKAGTVRYKWIQSHNQVAVKLRTLKFTKKGTKTVRSSWELGRTGKKYKNYWKKVVVISPNSMHSNPAVFNLECTLTVNTQVSAQLFPYSIKGTLAPAFESPTLEGRKVIIKLKKDGRTTRSIERSLGYQGRLEYMFKVRFPGNHTIHVEKGPSDPTNYVSTANICWENTTPSYRSVIVTSSQKKYEHKDFTINFVIAWDRHGWCWIP